MQDYLKEVFSYVLGLAIEGGKGRGWKGSLFLLPFLAAFAIVIYLFARIFI